jgi:hypothetical protein
MIASAVFTLQQILSSTSPPYSPTFAQWLVRHMSASGMKRKHAQGTGDLLRSFASACLAMTTTGPAAGVRGAPRLVLSPSEHTCLTELVAAR